MIKLGYHCLSVPDKAALIAHLERCGGVGGMLFYQNERDFARQVKERFPLCNVIMRSYPDADNMRLFPNVDDWIDRNQSLGDGGLIVQTVNEPALSPDSINWHYRLLTRIKARNLGLAVGMLALPTGNPINLQMWTLSENLFRFAETMRNQAFMLLHDYCAAVPTSGFIGGNPDHAGVAPGQPGGVNLIPMENWPQNTGGLTLFHLGRFRFMFDFLRSKGIRPPRTIISEFGCDYLGDVGDWLKTLYSDSARAGYPDTVDGWRELETQWSKWYPGQDKQTVYMKMGAYAAEKIYTAPEIEAVLWYEYGQDPNWTKYRVDPEMMQPMEDYAKRLASGGQPSQPPPVVTLPPDKPPTEPPAPSADISGALIQLRAAEISLKGAMDKLGYIPPKT